MLYTLRSALIDSLKMASHDGRPNDGEISSRSASLPEIEDLVNFSIMASTDYLVTICCKNSVGQSAENKFETFLIFLNPIDAAACHGQLRVEETAESAVSLNEH